jgi:Ca2+/Na+ antiporter
VRRALLFDTLEPMNSKIKLLVILGISVILLPILGIPRHIKDIAFFIIGGVVIIVAYLLRHAIKTLRLKLKRLEGQQGTLIQ